MSFVRKIKVVVTHPEIPESALKALKANEAVDVVVLKDVPSVRKTILESIKNADGILWADHQPLNAEALNAAGANLKAVSTMTAGLDHVDIDEFKKRKLPLGHTPQVLNDAVADVAIGLMISAARRFQEGRTLIESGKWENYHLQWMLGNDIKNSVVGFFGFGHIGQTIARRLKGFEIERIIYCTRSKVSNESDFGNAAHASFDQLVTESDIIFVACGLSDETKNKFDDKAFSKMKKNCVFVNIARGGIVDQNALYTALKTNVISAAGLDVCVPEPIPQDDPLLKLPNLGNINCYMIFQLLNFYVCSSNSSHRVCYFQNSKSNGRNSSK